LRILYILNALGGGASAGIYEAIPALRALGVIPYAVAPPGDNATLMRVRSLFDGVRIVPIPWWNIQYDLDPVRRIAQAVGRWRRGMTHAHASRAVQQAAHDWNIDLIHSGTALTLAGALAARSLKMPHVWHIKEAVGAQHRVRFGMGDGEMVEFFSDQSAHIIAMSAYVAGIFRAYDCDNISVIPDGVDVTGYAPTGSTHLRAQLAIHADQILVGMVAGLSSTWKRHDLFIASAKIAAARDPRLTFCIVGGAPAPRPFPYDSTRRYADGILASAHPLGDRFKLVDFVPDPSDIMRSLDILVHPCDVEPFGRIAIEAGAARTPVISVRAGGIAETVIDGQTGILVEPNNADALASAMLTLAADAPSRARLGAAARTLIRSGYGIETHAARIHTLYATIV